VIRSANITALAIVFALTLGACTPATPATSSSHHPDTATTKTESSTPTDTATGDVALPGVHTPPEGSTERDALLEAAGEYLASSAVPVVHACLATTSCALIDLELPPADVGARQLFALRRSGTSWLVIDTADAFDGPRLRSRTTFSSLDTVLLDAYGWTTAPRQLARAARSAALTQAAAAGGVPTSSLSATWPRLARTAGHEWWASCAVSRTDVQIDPLQVFLRWDPTGSGWCIIDCGTGINPQEDPRFPADVAGSL